MPAGKFEPHRSPDQNARVRHIEAFLARISAVVANLEAPVAAAKNTGGGALIASVSGGSGATGVLAGDATGPESSVTVLQASGAFSVLGGDLTVAAGKETITFTDAGGGADSPALRPTFVNLVHHTTATTVPGVGAALDWTVADDAAADQTIASLISEITQVTAGSLEATTGVVVKHQNQDCEVMRWRGQTGMAATSVGTTGALKGYVGGEAWCRGNFRVTGDGGSNFLVTDAGTNTAVTVATFGHLSTGTPAAGLGPEVHFDSQNSASTQITFGHLRALYAGGGAGAENGTFVWGSIMNGTKVDLLRFRTTVGMTPTGGIGGQVWCQADFFHSGNSFGVFNTTPISQLGAYTVAGTPTRTFPADPSVAYTGINNAQAGTPYAQVTDLNTLRGVVSSLLGVVNQLAKDAGKTSGFGFNAT